MPGVLDAGLGRSDDAFSGCRVADPSGDGLAVLNEADGDRPLRDALNELPCPIDGVNHPDAFPAESIAVVCGLLEEPPFAWLWEQIQQHSVDRKVCCGHGVVSGLHGRFDGARRERFESSDCSVKSLIDTFEIVLAVHRTHFIGENVTKTIAVKGSPSRVTVGERPCAPLRSGQRSTSPAGDV